MLHTSSSMDASRAICSEKWQLTRKKRERSAVSTAALYKPTKQTFAPAGEQGCGGVCLILVAAAVWGVGFGYTVWGWAWGSSCMTDLLPVFISDLHYRSTLPMYITDLEAPIEPSAGELPR